MSKTNHRRGDQDNKFNLGRRTGGVSTFYGRGKTPLSDVNVAAGATVFSENAKGIRRDRAGAKKFVQSRTRFHEDAALKKLVTQLEDS